MAHIIVSDVDGVQKEIELEVNASLMDVLKKNGYDQLEALCGGACACATCHVHIENQSAMALEEPEEMELDLLDLLDDYHAEQSRLSCQITLSESLDGLRVQLLQGTY